MGVLIAARRELNPLEIRLPAQEGIEAVACQIRCSVGTITIVSVYIHPSTPVSQAQLERFIGSIPQPCILAGDWNAKHTLWGNDNHNRRGELLVDALEPNNLVVLNDGSYTRYDVHRSPSAIDITLTSADLSLLFCWEVLDDPHGSDHMPIAFRSQSSIYDRKINSVNYKKIDWENFAELVDEEVDGLSPHVAYEEMFSTIWKCLERATPAPKLSPNLTKVPQFFWDDDLEKAKVDRHRKFGIWSRDLSLQSYEDYAEAEKKLKAMVKTKRRESWRNKCNEFKADTSIRTLWRMAKRYKGKASGSNNQLRNEDQLETFLDKLAPPSTKKRPLEFQECICGKHSQNGFFTLWDLEAVIKNTKDTAPGIDGICYSVLRNLPFSAKRILLRIFNQIYMSGDIPEAWKNFNIVPILKPHKPPTEASSFRPIALASCMRKSYENMIKTKIEWYLEHNQMLPDTICGFRKGKGTMDALHYLVDDVQSAFYAGEHVVACSIDIQGAYDNVQIDFLVQEMRKLNIAECLVRSVYALFQERYISASLDGVNHIRRTTWMGLPQGSPIAPLCFNIQIHGLFGGLPNPINCIDFADDITLAVRGKSTEDTLPIAQEGIDLIVERIKRIRLSVAPAKCSTILFHRRRIDIESLPPLTVNDLEVPFQPTMKLLGLCLTSSLSWATHFRDVKRRATLYMNFMKSIAGQSWGCDPNALLTIYKSCVRPILEYGSIFFCGASSSETIVLDRIQWSCIRIALSSTKTTHTGSLEVISGLMPLGARREKATMRFVERRYSLTAWHNQFVTSTFDGQSATWVRRNILQYKIHSGHLATTQTLPLFQFDLETWYKRLNIDTSLHTEKTLELSPEDAVEALLQTTYPDTIHLATDGSKDEDHRTGYAVVDSDERPLHMIKLPKVVSVFHAEFLALLKATQQVYASPIGKYVILTDSLSCLSSLENNKVKSNQPRIWFEIKQLVQQLENKGSSITYMWVPAHKNIPLNEAADDAAKEAALSGEAEIYSFTSFDIQFPSRLRAISSWQTDWTHGTKGRHCHDIIPAVSTKAWFEDLNYSRREIIIISKLISNHSRLPAHLYRNNIIEEDTCSCGEGAATPDHLLFNCDQYEVHRRQLWRTIIKKGAVPDLKILPKRKDYDLHKVIANFFTSAEIDL